jgi:hypothetical protein
MALFSRAVAEGARLLASQREPPEMLFRYHLQLTKQ